MRLLRSELRLRRVSLLVWFVSVVLLIVLVVAFYPSIKSDTSLDSLYADLSPSVQALLGGSDLTSPIGYLNTQVFAFFLPIVILIFGLGRGAASIAGEEEDRTLDLLLAQPVSRRSAYLQKSAAVATGVVVLTVGSWLVLWIANGPVGFDLPAGNLAAACVQMGLFCLALTLAAQAVSAATGRKVHGIAIVSAYTAVSYVVYGLSTTVAWLETARPLTLWRWYVFDDPLRTGIAWSGLAVLAAVSVACLLAGVALFERRDLRG